MNEDLPEPPYGEARLPLGNARQIPLTTSLDGVVAVKGHAFVQKNVDWGKDLLTLNAQGPGARMTVPFDVDESARYELVAEIAKAPNYGNYVALVDGQPTNLDNRKPESSEIPFPGPVVYHNYEPEVYVGSSQPLGFFRFDKGRHTVTLECVGKESASAGYNIGIYDVVLERLPEDAGVPEPEKPLELTPAIPRQRRPSPPASPVFRGVPLSAYVERLERGAQDERADALRAIGAFGEDAASAVPQVASALDDADPHVRAAAAWAFTQIGRAGASAIPAIGPALADASPQVRVLAALALEAMGPSAAPAVPLLVRAFDDPIEDVRVTAARALGAIGPAAGAAVPALTARIQATGEPRTVLVAAVNALGDIGRAAASALPALEQAAGTRQLGPSAREALLKIQGKPVPTWW